MSDWLGRDRDVYKSLGDAYASIYEKKGDLEQARKNVGADTCWDGYKAKGTKMKGGKSVPNCVKEEEDNLPEEYAVSDENHEAIMEGKKKCKEGYKYDSEKKKCVKKKKKSSSSGNKTTVVVKTGGRGGFYPGYIGGHGGGGGNSDDDDNEGGGDSGGGDGGGGGE